MQTAKYPKEIMNEWLAADSWDAVAVPKKKCRTGAPFTVQIVNACTSAIANVDIGDSFTGRTQSNVTGNWAPTNSGIGAYLTIVCFAINSAGIFAGGYAATSTTPGIYLSADNGATWRLKTTGITGTSHIACLLATTGSTLFAGKNTNGVFRSTDNGDNWAAVNTGLTNLDVNFLLISGSNLFAATNGGGVFLSTNNGSSWAAVNTGLTNTDVLELAIIGSNLFAATLGGVFLSTNNGTSWTAVNTGITDLNIGTIFADSNGNLWAGTYFSTDSIYFSANNGTTWARKSSGITNGTVEAFAQQGSDIYAGTVGAGVYKSSNNGDSWASINTGLTDLDVYDFLISGSSFFAATAGGGVNVTTFSNFGQNSNITITTPLNGITYQEFLAERENAPIKVLKTEIISTSAGQLNEAVTITHRDSNGNRIDHTVAPVVDPMQTQTDRVIERKEFLFDGFTRIRLRQLNGSATVTLRFHPEQCGDKPKRSPDFLPGEKLVLPEIQRPVYPVYISREEWDNTKDGNPIIEYAEPKIIKAMHSEIEKGLQKYDYANAFETIKKKGKITLTVCLQ